MRLIAIALFAKLGYGLPGIYLAQALSAVLPAAAGALYFRSRRWQKRRVI
jgi:Na+-driven multidrug efflux pump